MSAEKPILIPNKALRHYNGLHGRVGRGEFPANLYDRFLKVKRADPDVCDGVQTAIRLLLTEAAVAVHFVDTSSAQESYIPNGITVYRRGIQLAFNDHGGGSESAYKILLNRPVNHRQFNQYVLLSPPKDDGEPSNLTFYHASFTFPIWEPHGLEYADHLPNELKTAGMTGYYGRNTYTFDLFGDDSTPMLFADTFKGMGFDFRDAPYDDALQRELRYSEDMRRDRYSWPGRQFMGQLALLQS